MLKEFLKTLRLFFFKVETPVNAIRNLNVRGLDPFPLLLLGITVLLCWLNYTPGTWLTGWDTLHPEFNLALNLKRLIFGVWREDQGLGTVTAHAHMSELPRLLFLYVSSLFFNADFLRYFYFFAMLVIGPLGVLHFLKRVVFQEDGLKTRLAAFLGGLFYFLNLGTLQHFYVPFEMFATLYAFLPWLFLFATKYLREGKLINLLLFCVATILTAPSAYAATLWYSYFLFFGLYLLTNYLFNKDTEVLKKSVLLIAATIVINSFWLLPQMYFTLTSSDQVSQAKINEMFSDKAYETDKKLSTFFDASILKNYLFDWQEYKNGSFVQLLDEWQTHMDNPFVLFVGIIISLAVVFGFYISLRGRGWGRVLLPSFIFVFLFMIHGQWPLSILFSALRELLPVFKEGYRFPWTKVSIFVMFSYAVFFAYFCQWLFSKIQKKLQLYFASLIIIAIFIVWMLPAFKGNLISSSMKVGIPYQYTQVANWLNANGQNKRVTVLPSPSFWGWEYYKWGFQGAGFIWFGMDEAVLARDFDRWSPYNENYYWETNYALYSGNEKLLENTLEKYQVQWIIVDESIIYPSSSKSINLDGIYQLLNKSNRFEKVQEFGDIKLYKVHLTGSKPDNFVFIAQDLPNIGPVTKWNNKDQAYVDNGNYVSEISNLDAYYPFRSLFTGKRQKDREFGIKEEQDYYLFRNKLPAGLENYNLVEGQVANKEVVRANPADLSQSTFLPVETSINNGIIEVKVPKADGYYSATLDPSSDENISKNFKSAVVECNSADAGKTQNQKIKQKPSVIKSGDKIFLRLRAQNANNCSASFYLPNLPHGFSYLIRVEAKNVKGKRLLFWLENLDSQKADIETYLPQLTKWTISYFVQPPMENDGLGYSLHFDNISIADESVNDLGKITVEPIPYNYLTELTLQKDINQKKTATAYPVETEHPNSSIYEISMLNGQWQMTNTTLVLPQAYNAGWVAYTGNFQFSIFNFQFAAPFFGKSVGEHVLVNNWENGWILSASSTARQPDRKIVIVFWPQYLEYLGFVLAGGFFAGLWIFRRKIEQI